MTLNNLRVGTRLGAGFSIILVLLALMLVVSVLRLNSASDAVQAMMASPLAKERLLEEQLRNVAVGVVRNKAVAVNADGALAEMFRDDVKIANARGNEIVKALAELPPSEGEKLLLDKLTASRLIYTDARDRMLAAKRAGKVEEAVRIHDKEFSLVAPAYVKSLGEMLSLQRKVIDDMNKGHRN